LASDFSSRVTPATLSDRKVIKIGPITIQQLAAIGRIGLEFPQLPVADGFE